LREIDREMRRRYAKENGSRAYSQRETRQIDTSKDQQADGGDVNSELTDGVEESNLANDKAEQDRIHRIVSDQTTLAEKRLQDRNQPYQSSTEPYQTEQIQQKNDTCRK
jgi:hypothetical protein